MATSLESQLIRGAGQAVAKDPYGIVQRAQEGASQMRADAQKAANIARADKKKQDDLMEQQKQEYRDIEFKNPYENMENAYEDVTVNQ